MSRDTENADSAPKLNWIGSDVEDFRPDAFQVQSTREETILLCGTHQASASDANTPRAMLERRIVLPPAMAKQLAATLNNVVRGYERRQMALDPTPSGQLQSAPTDADVPQGAERLFGLVQNLGVDFGFEKSFKMTSGSLLADRLILGVSSEHVDSSLLLGVCRAIGMPDDYLNLFTEALPGANTIGFGFEGADGHAVYKVYLEYWNRLTQRLKARPGSVEPELLFLGFKWEQQDASRAALARYTCYPHLSVNGIQHRLAALYEDRPDSPSLLATTEILELASQRIGRSSFVYVEAAEEGNPRRSFDLNLYKAMLTVGDLRHALEQLAKSYSIPSEQFARAAEDAKLQPFGHLSGGLGRNGEDFLTCYYELEGI